MTYRIDEKERMVWVSSTTGSYEWELFLDDANGQRRGYSSFDEMPKFIKGLDFYTKSGVIHPERALAYKIAYDELLERGLI